MRYWAALGLRVLKDKAAPTKEALLKAAEDPDYCVRITARMALGNLGDPMEHTLAALADGMTQSHDINLNWALGVAKYHNFTEVAEYFTDKDLVSGPYSRSSYEHLKIGKTYTQLTHKK